MSAPTPHGADVAARHISDYLHHLAGRSRAPQRDGDVATRVGGPGGDRVLTVADLRAALVALEKP